MFGFLFKQIHVGPLHFRMLEEISFFFPSCSGGFVAHTLSAVVSFQSTN